MHACMHACTYIHTYRYICGTIHFHICISHINSCISKKYMIYIYIYTLCVTLDIILISILMLLTLIRNSD